MNQFKFSGFFPRAVAVSAPLLLSACLATMPYQQPQPTAEQLAMTQQMQAQFMAALQQPMGGPAAQAAVATAPVSPVAVKTEAELKAQYIALPKAKSLNDFEIKKDGLRYNGVMFADPAGPTSRFSIDPESATAAYLVKQTARGGEVKVARIGGAVSTLVIGTYENTGAGVKFVSVTGQSMLGQVIIPLADGALVLRDTVGFRYKIGAGIQQVSIPEGWLITPLQRGNVSSTGVLLLEQAPPENGGGGLLGAVMGTEFSEAVEGLKGALGGSTFHYALLNTNDGKLHLLNFSRSGKNQNRYLNCRKKNSVFNECADMYTEESLWDKYGAPNNGHYFWKVDWQMSNGQPVAVIQENSLRSVNALNLAAGKRVNLFERALGVNGISPFINKEGKLGVTAKLGLDQQTVEDVHAAIETLPAIAQQ